MFILSACLRRNEHCVTVLATEGPGEWRERGGQGTQQQAASNSFPVPVASAVFLSRLHLTDTSDHETVAAACQHVSRPLALSYDPILLDMLEAAPLPACLLLMSLSQMLGL